MIHVSVDGHVHEMGDDEHTACGLLVPPLTPWESSPVTCPKELGTEEPAPKKKATRARAKAKA